MISKDAPFSEAMRRVFFRTRTRQKSKMHSNIHPLSDADSLAAAALRSVVAPMKGKLEGTAGRGPFNDIMERIAVPEGVTSEAVMVGGIAG
jgi:hypothetical protein